MPIPYWMEGGADVAELTYKAFGQADEAAPHSAPGEAHPGSQLALFTKYEYHAFITDREGATWTWRPTTAATPRWSW